MARLESKLDGQYFPIESRHWPLIKSLFTARPGTRALDPFAGGDDPQNNGNFTHWLCSQLQMEGYANELNATRAESLIPLFGESRVVTGAAEHLSTPNAAFPVMWVNPPYDNDREGEGKRLELEMLKHSMKWSQPGGIVIWCVYKSHLTDAAAQFLSLRCQDVDVYALPGLHQATYTQIIAVCTMPEGKRTKDEKEALERKILLQRRDLPILTLHAEPKYQIPHNASISKFYFTSDRPDPDRMLRLLHEGQNALKLPRLKALLMPRPQLEVRRAIHPPRPGHMAFVLGSGILNGIRIDTEEYGWVMVRAAKERIKTLVDRKTHYGAKSKTVVSTFHEKVQTTIVLLTQQGKIIELSGDSQVLPFVAKYAKVISQHIRNAFDPLYKFDLSDYRKKINRIRLGDLRQFELYLPQKHVIAAALTAFKEMRGISLIAEMGTGKTAMGSGIAYLLPRKKGDVSIIVCPPHLVKKWARELTWMGISLIRQIGNVAELFQALKDVDANPHLPAFFIIKRDLTKLGSGFKPSLRWRPGKNKTRIPCCPTCGAVQRDSSKALYEAAHFEKGKRKCVACYAPLWQEARLKGGTYRARLDKVIKEVMADRLNLLLWDEIHEAKSVDTGNGEAFARLGAIARHVLAMTGTPMNGRSSSLYNIEFVLNADLYEQFPRGGSDRYEAKERGSKEWPERLNDYQSARKVFGQSLSRWVDIMGVREYTEVVTNGKEVETGKNTGTTEKEETESSTHDEIPGITPDLVAVMMPHTIYLSLNDFQKWLPAYSEEAEDIAMSGQMQIRYESTDSSVKTYMKDHRKDPGGIFGLLSSYLEWSLGWPNSPNRTIQILHTQNKEKTLVATCDAIENLITTPKEDRLIELVAESLDAGRPCIVYVRRTQTNDIQPRLAKLLQDRVPLARPYILRSSVAAETRERVISEKFAAGCNVLICHPKLVETGLDLIQFPRIIVYEIIYTLTTLMQAVRRALRLNQTAALCEVIYLYYGGTMEEKAMKLMSTKQRAMNTLLGKLGLTGFDALSVSEDENAIDQEFVKTLASESQVIEAINQEDMKAIDISDALFWVLNPEYGIDDDPEPIVIQQPVILHVEPVPQLVLMSRVLSPNKKARQHQMTELLLLDDDLHAESKNPAPVQGSGFQQAPASVKAEGQVQLALVYPVLLEDNKNSSPEAENTSPDADDPVILAPKPPQNAPEPLYTPKTNPPYQHSFF